jgi:ABC-type multidrug transport system permease subunit
VTEESQLNYYFPYLIVLVVMFIGVLLASTLFIMEKTSNAHFRNLITPTSDMTFMLGNFFTTFIILVVQVIIILLIYAFYFKQDIVSSLWPTSLIIFFIISLFTLLGMIIGNLFDSEETGTLASICLSSVFLFISDLVYPLEKMPSYVADIARSYNPFVFGTDLLRKSMVHKLPIDAIGYNLLALAGITAGAFLFAYLIHKVTKKQYLLRAAGYMSRQQLGKKYRAIEEKRIFEASLNVTQEKAFRTKKGHATTPGELSVLVSSMDDDDFRTHIDVATGKNDFAVWVKDVLHNDELADRLRRLDSRKATAEALTKAQEELERLGKKLEKQDKPKKGKAVEQLKKVEKKLEEKKANHKPEENTADKPIEKKADHR